MLQEQTLPINFGQGMDTKTDPKQVLLGKLALLQNGIFTKAKRVAKRNGYDSISLSIAGGGSLVAPKMVKSYGNELLCADGGRFYSYSSNLNEWVDKGLYISASVKDEKVSVGNQSQYFQSMAISGNYVLYVYSQSAHFSLATFITVKDLSTGTALLSDFELFQLAPAGVYTCPKAITLGASQLAVTYLDASENLVIRLLTISGSGVTVGSALTISSDMAGYNRTFPISGRVASYDIVSTASGAVLAYSSASTFAGIPTDVKIKTINTIGAVVNTATISSSGYASPITVISGSNGNVWVYWVDSTTPSAAPVNYAVFTSTLTPVLAMTTMFTSSALYVDQIAAIEESATLQTIYLSFGIASFSFDTFIEAYSANSSGSSSIYPNYIAQNMNLFGKPFKVGNVKYLPIISYLSPQETVFIVTGDTSSQAEAIAKSMPGDAIGGFNSLVSSFLTNIALLPSGTYSFLSPYVVENDTVNNVPSQLIGSKRIDLNFNDADSYQGVIQGGVLVLNGGIVSIYDGSSVTELGFNQYPSITTTSTSGTGGFIHDGTYTYYSVYAWSDAQGNLHQSAPSTPYPVVVNGGTNTASINVTITSLGLTEKNNQRAVTVRLYRTKDADLLPKLVSNLNVGINDPAVSTITITDTLDENSISGDNVLYTAGGVIENISPPAAMLLTTHNNRLFLVDSENINTAWYSKTDSPGTGISMSDLLTEQVDSRGGGITAIAEMDEKIVYFKRTIPFFQVGDGPNDLGNNSTFSVPQFIPSDVGCNTSKSVISMPGGVMFKSDRGIYILDRALNVTYIGVEVEDYNSQDITAAMRAYDKTQVRFLTSSGSSLLYDYFFNQWSVFTNHQGYSSDIWNGLYVYIRTDGSIFKENISTFLDNLTAYALVAKLAWMKLAGVQGFQRVRRFLMLGDYSNGVSSAHNVQVSAAYNFSASFSTPIQSPQLGAVSSSGVVQYRERLPIQKCDALQILIEELPTGAAGEYIDFTDLSIEVGVKKGLNKLPASQSVG